MKRFIRDFSKETSKNDRDALAREIHERRRNRESVHSEYNELASRLETISRSTFSKVVNFLEIQKLRKGLDDAKVNLQEVDDEMKRSKWLIDDFYQEQGSKWRNLPFDKEDIKRYFDPAYLQNLSLEEYKLLLQRFGGGMVSHVTRQGIRDHADMGIMGHCRQEGEMHNGFKRIIADGKLRYNLALSISESEGDKQIADYFNLKNCSTKESALEKLYVFTDETWQSSAGSFVDFHGPHFAVERVSDDFYGAETGNEIFFAFPSYMMASNYYHRNNPHVPNSSTNYNDLWTYLRNDDEIDIDSGLVFIPEDTEVDPVTGSVYETDQNGKAIVDSAFFERLKSVLDTQEFREYANHASNLLGSIHTGYEEYGRNMFHRSDDSERVKAIYQHLKDGLQYIIPDVDEKEMAFILNFSFLRYGVGSVKIEEAITMRMRDSRMLYVRAKNTINSKQYWEKYFIENKIRKPNKIVFYQGGNPNHALRAWKCLATPHENKDVVEMNEHRILKNEHDLPEHILRDIRAFKIRAERVINEYFDKESV